VTPLGAARIEGLRRRWLILGALVLATGVPGTVAWAHPHVWVDYAVGLSVRADGAASLEIEWTYDERWSEVLIEAADANRDKRLAPDEVAAFTRQHLDPLKRGNYFLEVLVDRRPVRVDVLHGVRLRLEGNRLTVAFEAPIGVLVAPGGTVEIRLDDPVYFVAFTLDGKRPVSVTAPGFWIVKCRGVSQPGTGELDVVQCTYRRPTP
jgi:ABC-type uncharacterized transport system substrate-binding protein